MMGCDSDDDDDDDVVFSNDTTPTSSDNNSNNDDNVAKATRPPKSLGQLFIWHWDRTSASIV